MTITDRIIILKNKEEVVRRAAEIFVEAVKRKPNIVLGLPTGKTFVPIYREIVRISAKKKISFAKVRTFNLDEFFGLKFEDRRNFRTYMNKNLFNKVNMREENIFMLNSNAKDFRKECFNYEREIKKSELKDYLLKGLNCFYELKIYNGGQEISFEREALGNTDTGKDCYNVRKGKEWFKIDMKNKHELESLLETALKEILI